MLDSVGQAQSLQLFFFKAILIHVESCAALQDDIANGNSCFVLETGDITPSVSS